MRSSLKLVVALALVVSVRSIAAKAASEDKPKIEELPKAVSTAIKNRFPEGQITAQRKRLKIVTWSSISN